jgi:phage terminase large subunit-like protein
MLMTESKKIWTPDNSYLLEYHARIETGEIIVGRELWQELNNLKEDILTDAYIYDTEDALLRMNFMENCVRLTKSPFYNKPMVLMLWQKAFIEAVYSFKMRDTTLRRFKKIILLIARKNTKSETCSALGLSEFFLGNAGADIVCSSNDDSQASLIYDAIDTMRMLIDPEDLDTKRNQRYILNKVNNTKIFKLSDRTRNKEGRNIDVAFLDESHEMKENVIAKSVEQSQSLKDEPLFINLTTEGFVVDGYLDDELKKARKIIAGEDEGIMAERTLAWLYTQDSEAEVWQNRNSWVKSNPSLGIVKKWSYLDEQIDLAKSSKGDRIFVLCKDFNIKQNSAQSWLNIEDYDYKAVYDLEDFRGCKCLGAVDLAETTDLVSAKVLLMKPDDKTKYVHTMYFIPEGKLENSDDRNAGAKYKEWAEAGLLTITEGHDLDLSKVADWFYSLYTDYNIRLWKCGYDQKFAKDFLTKMDFYGWSRESGELVMVLQNAQTLSNAIKLLEADLSHQLVNYNDNEIDKWCLKNACLKVNDLGQCLIIKAEPSKRIDGAVCKAILWEMYRQNRTEWRQMIGGAN